MSNWSQADSQTGGVSQPRAMIHKKILDIAQSNPDASLESIAADVSGASAVFVERVLEEYGDPATKSSTRERADGRGNKQLKSDGKSESGVSQSPTTESTEQHDESDIAQGGTDTTEETARLEQATETTTSAGEDGSSADTPGSSESTTPAELLDSAQNGKTSRTDETNSSGPESDAVANPEQLSDKQLETLRTVQQDPAATQEEIAETLGVTRATISKRLTDIAGFNWKTRRDFVETLFDDSQSVNAEPELTDSEAPSKISEIESRIDELETKLEETSDSATDSPLSPELTHKVVHSCMSAEYLSEEEELQLLRQLL
jgi:DNA-binding CsgD family transcriptional regulator